MPDNIALTPLGVLILQLILIVAAAQIFAVLFKKLHQPTVNGNIVAGIVLGPSVFGLFFPEIWQVIFPAYSLTTLNLLSELGIIFFMFLIGMEMDISTLQNNTRKTVAISYAGIIFPFILGVITAIFLNASFCPSGISFLAFSLFMGTAMSITAFPVLARIIQERGITKTHIGIVAISSAALGDISAWCLLSVVIALSTTGSMFSALFTIVAAVIYLFFMLCCVRPLLGKLHAYKSFVPVVIIMLFASAMITDMIGLHIAFGAFTAGIIMPYKSKIKSKLSDRFEFLCIYLLLPIFFAFSGLHTQINLLDSWNEWLICLIVILVATAGKFGGSMIAAKCVGENWKNALSIGVLMNTRGLMELVVLNIGYDLGILNLKMFTIMVLMALVTTLLTNPVLDLIDYYKS